MKNSVPQGSMLGLKNYVMYTKSVGTICRRHDFNHHFYTDDSQLYLSFKPNDNVSRDEAVRRVEFVMSVRNLGSFYDSQMNMESHVNNVCRFCYSQLRQIEHIRQYLNSDTTKSLVNSLVTSRLDYCNSLLFRPPQKTLNKLQIVQNTSAHIITRTPRRHHITPVRKELHWIPVRHRIQFKISTFTFKDLHGQAPDYIESLLDIYKPNRELKSGSNGTTFAVPKNRTRTYEYHSCMTVAHCGILCHPK